MPLLSVSLSVAGRPKAWWLIVGGLIAGGIITGIATGVGGDLYRTAKEWFGGSETKKPIAITACTVAGKAVNQYSRQPLDQLNVVVLKPNSCDIVMSTSTEVDGRFTWRGPCAEINGQPIQVSLGAANYCLMKTKWLVNKDVESSLLLTVDSPMLFMPGRCRPCPTRQMR